MKAAKAWCIAGLMVAAGFSSVSCGHDEVVGSGGSGGTGTVLQGGTGGRLTGRGGTTATGGSGGAAATTTATKLGRACIDDNDCVDTAAPGLTCITEKDTSLADGAPPKGLCTAPCTSDDDCSPLSTGSLCFPFNGDAGQSYCVEGCTFGQPGVGEPDKCHVRDEFACLPAGYIDTGTACTATSDCGDEELCFGGTCQLAVPACLPSCRGDIDCADGMYCDQSLFSGVCVAKKPVGKGLGEPCTVNAAGEPDDCLGFCRADDTGSTTGHCATSCGILSPCGFNPDSKLFDGFCLYASVLTVNTGSVGDFGFCTPTCNCTGECNDATLQCSVETQLGRLNSDFRGPGLCFSTDPKVVDLDECTGAGGAGAGTGGAAPNGSAGAGDTAGAPP
jgi:hypothetical protein